MDGKDFRNLGIITLFLLLLVSLGSVSAAGLLASPGGFDLNMSGPQTYQGTLTVENIGQNILNVTVDPKRLQMDSINLLFSDVGIAKWISINETNFILKPSEKKQVHFTVTVPDNVDYYDAMGALVVRGYPLNNTTQKGFNVQQVPELVIPVTVGLPGKITESLELVNSSQPSFLLSFMNGTFNYQVKNTGTVYANMTGIIQIKGWFNSHNVTMHGGVYPDDQYFLKTSWSPSMWDMGLYQTTTTINYGRYTQDKSITTHGWIFVFPVWLIILILIIVAVWIIRKKDIESPIKIKIEKK